MRDVDVLLMFYMGCLFSPSLPDILHRICWHTIGCLEHVCDLLAKPSRRRAMSAENQIARLTLIRGGSPSWPVHCQQAGRSIFQISDAAHFSRWADGAAAFDFVDYARNPDAIQEDTRISCRTCRPMLQNRLTPQSKLLKSQPVNELVADRQQTPLFKFLLTRQKAK